MIQTVQEKSSEYHYFVNKIIKKVRESMGDEYSVNLYKVIKNNSLELDSLVVLEKGKNYAPNLYLESYYASYLEGTPIEELAERLCDVCRQNTLPIVNKDFEYSYEKMKPYIIYRLINYEKNKSLLCQVPHLKQLDLAITFHCLVRNDEEGIGTIRITNEHVKLWNASTTELLALAQKNTRRLFPESIRSMEEVMRSIFMEESKDNSRQTNTDDLMEQFLFDNTVSTHPKMYILTNQKGINGASCLLYKDVLRKFADLVCSDFYILPSSIHEIILVPTGINMNKEALSRMVQEVNSTQVAAEEVLSDRVYYFSREKDMIQM